MTTTRTLPRAAATLIAALSLTLAAQAFAADGAGSASAAPRAGAAPAGERQRVASERAAAEARYAARELECKTRFIVTACIDEAKSERRDTLDKLRARQLGADEVRRRERAAARQSELSEKAAEDARVEKERAVRAAASSSSGAASQPARIRISSPRRGASADRASSAASAASAPAARSGGPDQVFGFSPHTAGTAAARQDREARSRAAFEKRKRQAAEHREEATTATLRRMASKSPASPLPTASGASAVKPR